MSENSQKTDSELAFEFVAETIQQFEMEPMKVYYRLLGDEPSYVGCPRMN
jgi:hypothetical protein